MSKKKEKMQKTNINNWYDVASMNKALKYALINIGVEGVREISNVLTENNKNYQVQMKLLVEKEQPNVDRMYAEWDKAYKIWQISKWVLIISAVSDLFINKGILFIIELLSLILFCIYGIRQYILKNKYMKYLDELQLKSNSYHNKYISNSKEYYEKIDRLYLASLSPEHRENVLLRRQMLRMEEKNQELLKQQIKNQNRMEEQQREMQKIQSELLNIEREREARYQQSRRW